MSWRLLLRITSLTRTTVLWSWRFHSFGSRSTVGKSRIARNPGAVSIGHHTTLCDNWSLADLVPSGGHIQPKIRIGSHCTILHDFQCNAAVSVEIQDHVLIAPRVFITDSDHVVGKGDERTTKCHEFRSAPVLIEHDCWLGVNSVVLKGVRIGHHSVIGANAVVTRSVPPYSTVVGIPGRIIGTAIQAGEDKIKGL